MLPEAVCSPLPSRLPTWARERQGTGPLTVKVFSRVLYEAAANHPSLSQCSSNLHKNTESESHHPPKKKKEKKSKTIGKSIKWNVTWKKSKPCPLLQNSSVLLGKSMIVVHESTDGTLNKKSMWALTGWNVSKLRMVSAVLSFEQFTSRLKVSCQYGQRQVKAGRTAIRSVKTLGCSVSLRTLTSQGCLCQRSGTSGETQALSSNV